MANSIQIFPLLTTVERDALGAVPDGASIYNVTNDTLEFTLDGGSSWKTTASTGDVDAVDLQAAYNIGNTIQMDSTVDVIFNDSLGSPVLEIIEAGASSEIKGYNQLTITNGSVNGPFLFLDTTSVGVNGNTIGSITSTSLSSTSTSKLYDALKIDIEDSISASFATSSTLSVMEGSTPTDYLKLDGLTTYIEAFKDLDMNSGWVRDTNRVAGTAGFMDIGTGPVLELRADTQLNLVTTAGPVLIAGTSTYIESMPASSLVATDASKFLVAGVLTGDVSTSGLAATLATVATGATVGDSLNVPQFTFNDKGLVTSATEIAIDLSASTLQTGYDNGDGVIIATFAKPLELKSVGGPTSLTFTRDQLGADGQVIMSIKSNGQTSTGAPVLTTTLEKRIATGANASYSEYVSSSAYTNAVQKQWFLYDGRTDVFQMKSALVDYHNETFFPAVGTLKEITISGRTSNLNINANYFTHTYEAQVVTDSIQSGKYTLNGISAGALIDYLEVDGAANTVKVPNSTSSVLDEVATVTDITLQYAYDNSDGTITIGTGKPVTVIGEDSADPGSINLYTPIKLTNDTVSSLIFYGNNDFNNKIKYGEVLATIKSPLVGSESGKQAFNVISSGTLSTYLELNGDTQSVDVLENLNLTTINDIQPSGGVFLQTANGAVLSASTTQTSILGTGIGSLTVPPNTFVVSGYKFDIAGEISANNNDTLTLRLVSNFGGIPTNLATLNVSLETAVGQFFELESDFVIKSTGAPGAASISTNMDFTYNRNTGNEFVGQRVVVDNNVTFDTTISNTLFLTAEFSSASAGNSIKTRIGTLTRTY